jgi:L-lactate dehydrogenase complex protein LldG
MIETFVSQLRANACVVHGPLPTAEARALVAERAHGLVACNGDVPFAVDGAMTPDDPAWSERLPHTDVGITGARIAVADPAAIALAAGPGAPRATSLVPPAHICVLRVDDIVPTLADALARVAQHEMPSALTWVGGPSRTGDLEMILTLGVHGPRTVEVVLLSD